MNECAPPKMPAALRIVLLLILFGTACRSQIVGVRSIDFSKYPVLRAELFAFDSLETPHTLNASDRRVTENSVRQTFGTVECLAATTFDTLSTVFVLDATSDSLLTEYRRAVRAWLNNSAYTGESALIEFGTRAYLVSDFSSDTSRLLAAVSTLQKFNGTSHHRALSDTLIGALSIASRGKYKRTVVIVSDGKSFIDDRSLIDAYTAAGVSVYALCVGTQASKELLNLVRSTRGVLFENMTVSGIWRYFSALSRIASGMKPCFVEWRTDSTLCNVERTARFDVLTLGSNAGSTFEYTLPDSLRPLLSIEPRVSDLGFVARGSSKSTSLTLRATGGVVTIDSIVCDNPLFSFQANTPVRLRRGDSLVIAILFRSTDDYRRLATFTVYSSSCSERTAYLTANQRLNPAFVADLQTLRGGETIYANSITEVRWSGVPPADTVRIDYTLSEPDWIVLTNSASGLIHHWRVPDTISNSCKLRIRLKTAFGYHYSESTFRIIKPVMQVQKIECPPVRIGNQREFSVDRFACNGGNLFIHIDSISSSAMGIEVVKLSSSDVMPSSCVSAEFRFKPRVSGDMRDTLLVYTNRGVARCPVSGTATAASARVPDFVDFGVTPLGVTRDSLISEALCLDNAPALHVNKAVSLYPDTAQFSLPEQKLDADLNSLERCKSYICRFNSTHTGRSCARLRIDVGGEESYETLLIAEGSCEDVVPHVGVELPARTVTETGTLLDLPLRFLPSPYFFRAMMRPYEIEVSFDRSILLPVEPTPMGVIVGNQRIVTIRGVGFLKGDTLSMLHFQTALGDIDSSVIKVQNFQWVDECTNSQRVSGGKIVFSNICRANGTRLFFSNDSLGIISIEPNPAQGHCAISYSLREDGATSLSLFDVFGREWSSSMPSDQRRGIHQLNMDCSHLPGGAYYLVLQTPTGRVSAALGVLR